MRAIKYLSAFFFSIALASCGGGGGGATSSANPTTVTGTVATGRPLGNAQIILTDTNGVSRTATSSASGSYTIGVTGLTAPFVVRATGLQGALSVSMVSVKDAVVTSSTNVINITPLTTAIAAQLSSTGVAADLSPVTDRSTIVSTLATVDISTQSSIATFMAQYGATGSPITTPFLANGLGYDNLYDHTKIGCFPVKRRNNVFIGSTIGPTVTYSNPSTQTTTYPNMCGSDIATGACIPCDPSQPCNAQPSVTLPPINADGGIAISGPGVQIGSATCSNGATNYPTCTLPTTLTVTKAGTGSGTVTSSPSGTSFATGTIVTLTATPATGSTFAGWSGACSGTGSCVVTMDANKAVTATFNSSVPSSSFNGTWSGTYSGTLTTTGCNPGGNSTSVNSSFSVNILNGVITGTSTTGSVSGSAVAYNITQTITGGSITYSFTGTLSGTTGSGTWSATGGTGGTGCGGVLAGTGTWNAHNP